jgi:hypothetical protein
MRLLESEMEKSVRIDRVQFNHPTMVLDTGVPSDYLNNGQVICGGDFSVKITFDDDERFVRVDVVPRTARAKESPLCHKSQLISLNNCRAILLAPEPASE